MKKRIAFVLLSVWTCSAQIVLPEGTKVRVRLDQHISSATAVENQTVELSVTDAILVGDSVVIPEGARATGTITQAQEKRRLGRAGKLDFSIDRVKTMDNQWIPLRYSVTKKSGQSHAVSTGILTAGVAAVFWPAAPVFLLRKGADITINRGTAFDVFTDANHVMNPAAAPSAPTNTGGRYGAHSSSSCWFSLGRGERGDLRNLARRGRGDRGGRSVRRQHPHDPSPVARTAPRRCEAWNQGLGADPTGDGRQHGVAACGTAIAVRKSLR